MKPEYSHIQILPIDKRPADWTEPKAWPSEGLLLKVIAAASRAEVLKGA